MQGKIVNNFMAEKAGMTEVDKNKIAETIEKMTAGTPKAIHEKEMQQKRSLQMAEMLKKCSSFSDEQRQEMKRQWLKQMNQMRQARILDRYWAHFDFDMFYIACQLLDKPELKDKPCAVGGKYQVLSTANYEARKYGLRAAMPTFIALELCPQVVLFETNISKYKHYSNIFREILSTYDPDLESRGLDEASLDLTNHLTGKTMEEMQDFLQRIRKQIFDATGLTVSCGVGANKMLAKLASEERKPNNQFILQNDGILIEKYMSEKKIRKIQGIGPVNEYYLKSLQIHSGKDILENVDVLSICFSKSAVQFFVESALGIGPTKHEFKERKSVGKSEAFKVTSDEQYLQERIRDLCEQVSVQLQELGFLSMNVVLTYKNYSFEKKDKTFNLVKYTDQKGPLFDAVINFLKSLKTNIRLLGIKCTNLIKVEQFKKQQLFNYLGNPKKVEQAMEIQKNSVDHIKTLMRNEVVQKGKYLCPICSKMIDCKGNVSLFNKHVDKCLSNDKSNETANRMEPEADLQAEVRSVQTKSTKRGRPKKGGGNSSLAQFLQKK